MKERKLPIFEVGVVVIIFSLLGGYSVLARQRARVKNAPVVMRGDHPDCMMVVHVDGHTMRLTPEGDQITTKNVALCQTTPSIGGYLGVLQD